MEGLGWCGEFRLALEHTENVVVCIISQFFYYYFAAVSHIEVLQYHIVLILLVNNSYGGKPDKGVSQLTDSKA